MGYEICVLLKSCMRVAKQAAKYESLFADHKYKTFSWIWKKQSEDDNERKVETEDLWCLECYDNQRLLVKD